jgi:hypothetical protein
MPLSNRDFVNQRSWIMRENEYVIMNHSVKHPEMPEKKGFVRAISHRTGYHIERISEGGCTLTYLTQSDPRGYIPTWLINMATRRFAPNMISKLKKAADKYTEWKKVNNSSECPWRE